MVFFDEILISIQKGDIITSKKGILAQSPITKEWYINKKARYLENGKIEVLGELSIMFYITHISIEDKEIK